MSFMKKILLYHGSGKIVKIPEYGKGNAKNDYGLGFYCTKKLDLAKEWACSEGSSGFANKYELETSGLKIMRLNSNKYNILNWLAILLENRTFDIKTPVAAQAKQYILENFMPDYKTYDIIIGYRADDSYFSFSRSFLDNGISLEQLKNAMHLGKLGEQIVLKSQNAFQKISFLEAEAADGSIFFPKRKSRDTKARTAYLQMLGQTQVQDSIYVMDLIRQNIKNNDPIL